jgi:hypothetical protein
VRVRGTSERIDRGSTGEIKPLRHCELGSIALSRFCTFFVARRTSSSLFFVGTCQIEKQI